MHDLDSKTRALAAYAVSLAGETSLAESIFDAELSRQHSPQILYCFDATRGLIHWRLGDQDKAWKHLNLALTHAVESGNAEWIAWAHLHLLRFAIDVRPFDAQTIMLGRTRRAVTRAGASRLSAYLHTTTATMEASRGS